MIVKACGMIRLCAAVALAAVSWTASGSFAASVTGNPSADGWTQGGNSLANGTYVRGSANYGFDVYGTSMTVTPGSNLDMPGSSWLAGDTVLGLGGIFSNTDPSSPGWAVTDINANLAHASGPKLQAKFGTDLANFTASTIAPTAGNGNGSLSFGGDGAVQIRTSAYNTASLWAAGSGILNPLASSSHITRFNGTSNANAARIMWIWSGNSLVSWEVLLNLSLLGRTTTGTLPSADGLGLLTVQDGDNAYTDALMVNGAAVVPLPSSAWMGLGLLGAVGLARNYRRKMA